jgi:hypothetical protein
MSRIPNIAFLLGYSRKQKQKIPFSASLITASLITGEPAGAYEAGHQADSPHPRLVLRGEEPQSLRDKLNRARKYCSLEMKFLVANPYVIFHRAAFFLQKFLCDRLNL